MGSRALGIGMAAREILYAEIVCIFEEFWGDQDRDDRSWAEPWTVLDLSKGLLLELTLWMRIDGGDDLRGKSIVRDD